MNIDSKPIVQVIVICFHVVVENLAFPFPCQYPEEMVGSWWWWNDEPVRQLPDNLHGTTAPKNPWLVGLSSTKNVRNKSWPAATGAAG